MSRCDTCKEHSGIESDILNIKEEAVKQGTAIEKMHTKLNMILGAIALTPFLWSILTGLVKTAQTVGG